MGIVVFLFVCWLVAYGAAGGWPRARRPLAPLASRLRHHTAAPTPAVAAPARLVNHPGAGAACTPDVPPGLADLEFPARAAEEPSMEGRLVTALLTGAVTAEHYHKAMHVLAARDERSHPMPPVAS
jgi:hypothetical protein